eukprot:TRINITY_DN67730_c0_g1_i1.p1 TRINITY_DN67730_c0_g1~~TRINITY_DN67730_c0_g1_i1.p1  ORF type:complete len:181 (+),score=33.22 TRINITY_DN67730_c0_g1_i1:71-544(+)
MAGNGGGAKLTQEELLDRLSEKPFDMRNVVPGNAVVESSPEQRWWRSDSPERDGSGNADVPRDPADLSKSQTRGVLGFGERSGPGCYQTSYQTGSGTAAQVRDGDDPKTIAGYSGFVPGKYAGNVIGGTFNKSNEDAQEHLKQTAQAQRFGKDAQQQ